MSRIVPIVLMLTLLLGLPAATNAVVKGVVPPPNSKISESSLALVNGDQVMCSAVHVGPNVVLTASHCLGYQGISGTRVGGSSAKFKSCAETPRAKSPFVDYSLAVCVADRPIDGSRPASLATAPFGAGDTVFLSGVGCRSEGGLDREFGKLSVGKAFVLPPAASDVLIFRTSGPATGCPGDSGGGVYDSDGPAAQLVGVIAGGNSDQETYVLRIDRAIDWLTSWARSNNEVICGVYDPTEVCVRLATAPIGFRPMFGDPPFLNWSSRAQILARAKGTESVLQVYQRVCGRASAEIATQSDVLNEVSGRAANDSVANGEVVTLPPCPVSVPHAVDSSAVSTTKISVPVSTTLAPLAAPIFSLATTDGSAQCHGSALTDTYPYDAELLLDVLRMNRLKHRNLTTAEILIADSGLAIAGQGFFPPELFSEFKGNWPALADQMRPIPEDSQSISHGTEVASVALGGPLFAYAQAYSDQRRFKLTMLPIYQQFASGLAFDSNTFSRILDRTHKFPGTIVNLSFRSSSEISEIPQEANRDNSSVLFVVAAGNEKKKLDFGGAPYEAAFPALYGGNARSRLITVAALDGQSRLAAFSNWSPTYVDIAAPGCAIPVLAVSASAARIEHVMRSGTSLAAPLVTFTAALIRSETNTAAENLKRRILVSADLTPGLLADQVIDGRRLNVVKAAAVASDVLETTDGIHFGTIAFVAGGTELHDGQKVHLHCEQLGDQEVLIESILKFSRFGTTPFSDTFRLYHQNENDRNPNSLFQSDLCVMPTDWSIAWTDDGATIARQVPMRDVIDYVRHQP